LLPPCRFTFRALRRTDGKPGKPSTRAKRNQPVYTFDVEDNAALLAAGAQQIEQHMAKIMSD